MPTVLVGRGIIWEIAMDWSSAALNEDGLELFPLAWNHLSSLLCRIF
jgi:hypothetical protein